MGPRLGVDGNELRVLTPGAPTRARGGKIEGGEIVFESEFEAAFD
jgi:hypothetical protein